MPEVPSIHDLDDLREHLQWAIDLELSTLPPYLCALYTLDPERNPEAAAVLRSVAVEEMLHAALVANLLNAVGGRPHLDGSTLRRDYPQPLPHSNGALQVSLLPFGHEAIELFLSIERPASAEAEPQTDGYATIGQFYAAIMEGLLTLCHELGEAAVFCGDPARQVIQTDFHGGAGHLAAIDSLATALEALDEIVEEGEGMAHHEVWDGDRDIVHPDRNEVAHHYRFLELKLGRRFQPGDTPLSGPTGEAVAVDWDGVIPMRTNPRSTDHPAGSPARIAQLAFDAGYAKVLNLLHQTFDGDPPSLDAAVGAMYRLSPLAVNLLSAPTDDGLPAGPSFATVSD